MAKMSSVKFDTRQSRRRATGKLDALAADDALMQRARQQAGGNRGFAQILGVNETATSRWGRDRLIPREHRPAVETYVTGRPARHLRDPRDVEALLALRRQLLQAVASIECALEGGELRLAPIATESSSHLRPPPTTSDHHEPCQVEVASSAGLTEIRPHTPVTLPAEVADSARRHEFLDEHFLNDVALEALGRLPESERPVFQTRLRAVTAQDILRLVTRDTIPVPSDAARPRRAPR
jgi:DNA-binding transcriptional regulator YdaS (Cro superfamily)